MKDMNKVKKNLENNTHVQQLVDSLEKAENTRKKCLEVENGEQSLNQLFAVAVEEWRRDEDVCEPVTQEFVDENAVYVARYLICNDADPVFSYITLYAQVFNNEWTEDTISNMIEERSDDIADMHDTLFG